MRTTNTSWTTAALCLILTTCLLLAAQPARADCSFSGGKIFSLTKERGKPMVVLATFSGSGNWWQFETRDKIYQQMLTSAFFNKSRIYITGDNEQCVLPRFQTMGSTSPKLGGKIKRIFAL